MNSLLLEDQIMVHASNMFSSIFVVEKESENVLLEVPVGEMPPAILQCFLLGDEGGLSVLVAEEYQVLLPSLIEQAKRPS